MRVEQRSPGKRGYVPLFVAICLFSLSASSAFATDYTVTMTGDVLHGSCGATCSLRDAIIAANLNPGPDRTIEGNDSTVDASLLGPANLDRVFDIQSIVPAPITVTINHLTITGGSA